MLIKLVDAVPEKVIEDLKKHFDVKTNSRAAALAINDYSNVCFMLEKCLKQIKENDLKIEELEEKVKKVNDFLEAFGVTSISIDAVRRT